MSDTKRTLPALLPAAPIKLPTESERRLTNGLTVIAIRRPAVPLVEVRLRLPFAKANLARGAMLSHTLFSGTAELSTVEIAAELQSVGGGLSASVDPDRLMISGNSLAAGLTRILEILGEVLDGAAYPSDEVGTERDRLVDHIQVAKSQPAHLAREALLRRLYGRHPYAVQTPEPEQVRAVRPAQLRALHAERVHPAGATLVLVGDFQPKRALDTAEAVLGSWNGGGKDVSLPNAPQPEPGPVLLVDRPDSVQSSLRMALPAVPRTHPDHAALQLANLVFGGYFSSRWVENIREDKGYTYGPHSVIDHSAAGSVVLLSAEVATDVTGPALLETVYELGRMATLPPGEEELEQARQYLLGTLMLGVSTQSGIAALATTYAGAGLRLDFLSDYTEQVRTVTRDDVAAAAAKYLAPSGAVTVILGDASKIEAPVATLREIEVE
ncbi:pitrilysin family protein [Asanoa sp. NPDC049518]|uniref:M16 family metallopeptidase n=1 Tax=unclassified Asanoa TaxID=2685164 RepID=UPI00342C165D